MFMPSMVGMICVQDQGAVAGLHMQVSKPRIQDRGLCLG